MRRDLEIKEYSPLTGKQVLVAPGNPLLTVLCLFEVIVLVTAVLYLPRLSDSCDDAPLKLWASLLVALCGAHLIVFGLDNLVGQLAGLQPVVSTLMTVIHSLMITGMVVWLGFGHFWIFCRGLDCLESNVFLIAILLAMAFDGIFIALGTLSMLSFCKNKSREQS